MSEESRKFILGVSVITLIFWLIFNVLYLYSNKIYYFLETNLYIPLLLLSAFSLLISIIFLFYFKRFKYYSFLPLLINAITIILNIFWPTNYSYEFYRMTQLELPPSSYGVNQIIKEPSFLGDGESFYYFSVEKEENLIKLLESKPFLKSEWINVVLPENYNNNCFERSISETVFCKEVYSELEKLDQGLSFNKSENIFFAIKMRGPRDNPMSNYTKIIVDLNNLLVFVVEFDS